MLYVKLFHLLHIPINLNLWSIMIPCFIFIFVSNTHSNETFDMVTNIIFIKLFMTSITHLYDQTMKT